MDFTFLFCILPVLIVAAPYIIGAIAIPLSIAQQIAERKRKNDLADARLNESRLKQERMIEERQARSLIAEAKAASENNKAVKTDLERELLLLKIRKERLAQGLDQPDFTPKDYPS